MTCDNHDKKKLLQHSPIHHHGDCLPLTRLLLLKHDALQDGIMKSSSILRPVCNMYVMLPSCSLLVLVLPNNNIAAKIRISSPDACYRSAYYQRRLMTVPYQSGGWCLWIDCRGGGFGSGESLTVGIGFCWLTAGAVGAVISQSLWWIWGDCYVLELSTEIKLSVTKHERKWGGSGCLLSTHGFSGSTRTTALFQMAWGHGGPSRHSPAPCRFCHLLQMELWDFSVVCNILFSLVPRRVGPGKEATFWFHAWLWGKLPAFSPDS